jgi:hypothetical protein
MVPMCSKFSALLQIFVDAITYTIRRWSSTRLIRTCIESHNWDPLLAILITANILKALTDTGGSDYRVTFVFDFDNTWRNDSKNGMGKSPFLTSVANANLAQSLASAQWAWAWP